MAFGDCKFQIDWGLPCLLNLLDKDFHTVLDIGSGDGEHKRFFEYFDKDVTSVDFDKKADYSGDFMEIYIPEAYDLVWCSHVLEHQRNPGYFLEKLFSLIKDDGYLAITVPRHPQERLVAGHLTAWSVYLLCYNLILSGFDLSQAEVFSEHEISLITRKKQAKIPEKYRNSIIGDDGDMFASLREYFPITVDQGMEIGDLHHHWEYGKPTKPVEIISRFIGEPLVWP